MLVTNRIRSECFEKVFENSANYNWSIFFDFCSADRHWGVC